MYYAGRHLKCSNVLARRGRRCWNHVQVPVQLARRHIVSWLVGYLDGVASLREAMVDIVWKELDGASSKHHRRQRDSAREIAGLERQSANLAAAIAEGGQLQTLLQKLRAVEDALQRARAAQLAQTSRSRGQDDLPSKAELERNLPQMLLKLVDSSFEFADVMRQIFPEFVIQPVEALDSGQVRPRARLTFRPGAIANASGADSEVAGSLKDLPVTLDLFEPPLHIRHLHQCVAAKRADPRLSLKTLAGLLGLNHMTVKRAFDYARLMEQVGTVDPYREVLARPEDASRWRIRAIAS
jgi:site-specific DNA recombinase